MPAPGVTNRLFRGSMRVSSRGRSRSANNADEDMANGSVGDLSMTSPGSEGSENDVKPTWDSWFKDAHLIRVRMDDNNHEGSYKSFKVRLLTTHLPWLRAVTWKSGNDVFITRLLSLKLEICCLDDVEVAVWDREG